MVRFWNGPEQLKAETLFALQDIQKRHPAVGWVHADGQASIEAVLEIAQLRQRIAELELERVNITPDFAAEIAALQGTVTVKVEEYSDSFDPEPTGEVFEEDLALSQIALRARVAALEIQTLYRIEGFVKGHSIKKTEFDYRACAAFQKDFSLRSLLRLLESKLIFHSKPYTRQSGGTLDSGQHWYLTDDARIWISGVVAQDDIT